VAPARVLFTNASSRSFLITILQDEMTETLAKMAKKIRVMSEVEGELLRKGIEMAKGLNVGADRNNERLHKAQRSLQEQVRHYLYKHLELPVHGTFFSLSTTVSASSEIRLQPSASLLSFLCVDLLQREFKRLNGQHC
jgi:hypothetical protein